MTFRELVAKTKEENHGLQIRFVAFIAHLGFKDAYSGNVASRNARFMGWIAMRKADYAVAHQDKVSACSIGGVVILDQDDFTDFIVSGEWIK